MGACLGKEKPPAEPASSAPQAKPEQKSVLGNQSSPTPQSPPQQDVKPPAQQQAAPVTATLQENRQAQEQKTGDVVPNGHANASPSNSEQEGSQPGDDDEDVSVKEGLEEFYELGEEIGRGGFSVVLEGRDKQTGLNVAIKCVQLSVQADDDAMIALKREIRIMKKVDHPNILKLYEVFVEEESFYLVMELVPGKELFERIIDRGQYSERHASNITRQIVSAVEYLHSNGIAHRDLKPENLLSSGDDDNEVIKIIDFGLSKKFGDEQLVTSVGSPGYVAPEVLTAESYDKSVDMWSVGVILYILLCGFPPFFADTSTELFKKIIDVKYDFEDPAWDDVSEAPKNIIRNLLVKNPADRLTAKQLMDHPWVKGIGVGEKQLVASSKMKTSNLK